ncbi:MAG: hypothetical protein LBD91_07510 [Prevotellaceae bacterium]|nr:hypothetical protein [Prevotellaceae bacterium]
MNISRCAADYDIAKQSPDCKVALGEQSEVWTQALNLVLTGAAKVTVTVAANTPEGLPDR